MRKHAGNGKPFSASRASAFGGNSNPAQPAAPGGCLAGRGKRIGCYALKAVVEGRLKSYMMREYLLESR
ncbi:MAG: hypothetical protein K2J82_09010 [Muribaculaceae bacterium]|nr:hypothetical protein [Muribaculaceae bacterium]